VSRDGRASIVAATLRAAPNPHDVVKRITAALRGRHDVRLGGTDVAGEQVNVQANHDLGLAELLAFPLLAILALIVFRGVAAALPLAVGATAVLGTFVALRAVNAALPLSAFALNLVIGLGLGLAVDYSLFLVSRFREELGRGNAAPDALRSTLATAGRTVVFSALTVAAAMACLTVFPQRFLVSMGIGGVLVALIAAGSALLVLPALFILLGARLGRVRPRPQGTGRWYRLAHRVMRRPGLVAGLTAVGLLVVASPTVRAHWSGIDATVLPTSQSARVVSDILARDFPARDPNTVTIAASGSPAAGPALSTYAKELRRIPGVAEVRPPRYLGRDVWEVVLGARGDPLSAPGQRMVQSVRSVHSPVPVAVGGQAADFHDQRAAIAGALPLALALLVLGTLLILWVMTGSVVLPVKTLLMNVLTAATATGLLVFVFQDGRLAGPLGYTSQGGIEQTDFLVLAALVFALSTDYGVMLLTRIKEARDQGHSDREAVAVGLERSGAVVTAAAILLAVAIGAFATSKVIFLKEVGLGTAAAVLIDAFVVRALLVPTLMALLGRRNWWSPPVLRRLHERLGVGEAPAAATGVTNGPVLSGEPAAHRYEDSGMSAPAQ
jgi:RND superfamily putative drug exporter